MRRLGVLAAAAGAAVFSAAARALPAGDPAGLAAAAQGVRRAAGSAGVHVVDLATGASVYELQADRPLILASNTKLLTTAAALELLGPGTLIETLLLARGRRQGEAFEGDLAVVGAGDPNLSGRLYDGDPLGALRPWARAFASAGVARVSGDLYLVHGLFDDGPLHADWPPDQLSRWYEAPVAALSFNDNCTLVRVAPGASPGSPAGLELVPDLGFTSLRNRARTGPPGSPAELGVDRLREQGEVIEVTGSIPVGAAPFETWVPVGDPVGYFGAALKEALRREGVRVDGRLLPVGALPRGGWRRLATHRSDLLATLAVVNKRSQNFFAESLFKLLGARACGDGSWRGGRRAVEDVLAAAGIARGSYQLADGSGMSRGNRLAPRQMTSLLAWAAGRPWGEEFRATLPVSGEEGLSWEHRLAQAATRGRVFAKTGSLAGVSTLSGYARGRSGALYAFAILLNDLRDRWGGERGQDAILAALVDGG